MICTMPPPITSTKTSSRDSRSMLADNLMGGQCETAVVSCGDVLQCRAYVFVYKNTSVPLAAEERNHTVKDPYCLTFVPTFVPTCWSPCDFFFFCFRVAPMRVFDFPRTFHGPVRFRRLSATQIQTPLFSNFLFSFIFYFYNKYYNKT